MRTGERPSKLCATCGRRFAWRRRWRRSWDEVRYCSRACRRQRPGDLDRRLEEAILELLTRPRPGGSICPSQAARRVRPQDWRPLMERTRRAARRLAAEGKIDVLQKGSRIDPSAMRGPVRLALARTGS